MKHSLKQIVINTHKKLVNSDRINYLHSIKRMIGNTHIKVSRFESLLIHRIDVNKFEIGLRQKLFLYLCQKQLNKSLILSTAVKKNRIFVLPYLWQSILLKNGFRVSTFLSCFFFWVSRKNRSSSGYGGRLERGKIGS